MMQMAGINMDTAKPWSVATAGTGVGQKTSDPSAAVKGFGQATTAIGGIGQISEGLQAYSFSKLNAGILNRQGKQAFADHMSCVRQEISSYVQKQAGSGLVRNRDIEFGALAKGARDAAEMQYAKEMEANQVKYEGKMAKIQGIAKGVSSISSAFTPV
jgi:hypothetical protein